MSTAKDLKSNYKVVVETSDTIQLPLLFTHPACTCGPVIDLVRAFASENESFKFKEVSLISPDGRKQAFAVGVKTIPSLWFPDGTLFVGTEQITKENIASKI